MSYKELYPIFVFDVSKQSEQLQQELLISVVELRLEITPIGPLGDWSRRTIENKAYCILNNRNNDHIVPRTI